jgi:hypothetical protein
MFGVVIRGKGSGTRSHHGRNRLVGPSIFIIAVGVVDFDDCGDSGGAASRLIDVDGFGGVEIAFFFLLLRDGLLGNAFATSFTTSDLDALGDY